MYRYPLKGETIEERAMIREATLRRDRIRRTASTPGRVVAKIA